MTANHPLQPDPVGAEPDAIERQNELLVDTDEGAEVER